MKKIFALIAVASLAACSGGEQPADPAASATDKVAQPAEAAAGVPAGEQGHAEAGAKGLSEYLPDPNLQFKFEHSLKSDQVVDKEGVKRRGVSIEYKGGVQGAALWKEIDSSFAQAGFQAKGQPVSREDGVGSRRYERDGVAPITVSVSERNESELAAGTGIIWFGWDV
ncbi:hypothetical protein D3C81_343370 [compost metagenome]